MQGRAAAGDRETPTQIPRGDLGVAASQLGAEVPVTARVLEVEAEARRGDGDHRAGARGLHWVRGPSSAC